MAVRPVQTRLAPTGPDWPLTDRRLSLVISFQLLLFFYCYYLAFLCTIKGYYDLATGRWENKIIVLLLATPLGTQPLRWNEWQSNRKFGRLSIIVIIWSSWCFS